MKTVSTMNRSQSRVGYSTLQVVRNWTCAFSKGFADSLRGAIKLFLLDNHRAQQREQKLEQREIDRELILNRNSPVREVQNIAKKRALERRERERLRDSSSSRQKKSEPNIMERTLQCMLLNGAAVAMSIVLFENGLLPILQAGFDIGNAGSQYSENLSWSYIEPLISIIFSTFWILPVFLICKVVNAIWFQDIADLAFRSTQGRPMANFSISMGIADTVFTIAVEMIFLVQGKVFSYVPIKILGVVISMVHQCLLHSLYCFEYKWYSQGIELHRRLDYVETEWPYYLGFGLPLAVLTSLPESVIMSGCVFSILFPLFIVSANQAVMETSPGVPPLNIFSPTILISNAVFSRTISKPTAPSTYR